MNEINKMLTNMMSQKHNSSRDRMDTPKAQDPPTAFLANKKATPSEGGYSTKFGGMWTFKHEIISPKFYELLIKT